ncbi:MAG: hypothetical protein QG588_1438, partial [Candidatus Poribacteria bacterium]|nr:hypothetical protein [Candidatus Poribacteria bacterium]
SDPSVLEKPELVANSLSPILGVSKGDILQKFDSEKHFIWLKRQLPEQIAKTIKMHNFKGLDFQEEGKRFYPQGALASHVLGFVGLDNIGLEGIEKKYDTFMRRETNEILTRKDRKGRDLDPLNVSYNRPAPGHDLLLTLDSVIQSIVERGLQSTCEKWNANGGSVIVMNPKTGEILALANYPTYNLNNAFSVDDDSKRNRALIDLYEPGSAFKIITASSAINENLVNPNEIIDCENGEYRVNVMHDSGSHVIDQTQFETDQIQLTFREVIEESSNIGTVKIAKRLGKERLYEYIKAFGLGEKTGVDTLETDGIVKEPKKWTARSMDAIPYGQEILVTAIQMLSATNAIANDGVIMQPFIVKKVIDGQDSINEFIPSESKRPISAKTAQIMKSILIGAVENGTGQKAKMDGYMVAGKTGTSQKASEDGKGYLPGKYVSSFVGFLPADKPLISMIIVIDEPQGEYLGGVVSCPVFKEIATQIMQYLTVGQGVCVAKMKPTS